MTIEQEIATAIATVEEVAQRILNLGSFGTAGPDGTIGTTAPPPTSPHFVGGWWTNATPMRAHPGRVGGPISAIATGLHTCDMLWEEWGSLVEAWTKKPGDGACANFLIGPTAGHGVIQFIPIDRNSNHMGGPGHGVFVINGKDVHPNTVTNSIEIHCAGGVRLVGGDWRLVEDGKAHGAPIPADDVIPDPQRSGRGWHKITDYQYAMADLLLHDLDAVQTPLPTGTTIKAFGEVAPAIAHGASPRVVTHWEMDPVHRSDPWPQACSWLRARS